MSLALLVIATSAQSAELAQSVELMQVMSAHEITAGTLKRGMRQQKAAGSLTAKQLECVEAIPAADFRSSVASAIADKFSDEEVSQALAFFRTPTGIRMLATLHAALQGKTAAEPLNAGDRQNIEAFKATSAGDKIINHGLPGSADNVAKKMMELNVAAIEKCESRKSATG
jgi:hypothetical protein